MLSVNLNIKNYTLLIIHYKLLNAMWWKIMLGVIGLVVIGFVIKVIKMAITEAKEETNDIERADELGK